MQGQIQLHQLLDLALCEPDIGCVNFNHLRTLLHSMLKLNNLSTSSVSIPADAGASYANLTSQSISLSENEDESLDGAPEKGASSNQSDISEDNTCNLKQQNLENRILSIEKLLQTNFKTYPSNLEILYENNLIRSTVDAEKRTKTEHHDVESSHTINIHDSFDKLSVIWEVGRMFKRIETTEEAITKLFSMLNEMFKGYRDKPESLAPADLDELKKQFGEMQEEMSTLQNKLPIADNIELTENLVKDVNLLKENIHGIDILSRSVKDNSMGIQKLDAELKMKNCQKFEEASLNTITLNEEEKSVVFMNTLNELIQKIEIKADQSEVGTKANISELNQKADKSAVDIKADSTDVKDMQCTLMAIQAEIKTLDGKLNTLSSKEETIVDIKPLYEKLDMFETKMKEELCSNEQKLNNIDKELLEIRQSVSNIDDEKLLNMLQNIEELKKLSNEKEIVEGHEEKINKLTIELVERKQSEINILSSINDLTLAHQNLQDGQKEMLISMPTFDASVMAAIQHLTQENRHQITALQSNIKNLQKAQVSFQPKVIENFEGSNEILSSDVLGSLQNHILLLQDQVSKHSGHISNMFDDYKEEFNRKQLHIDALYDYVDKLQSNKADKNDLAVEMDIKANKLALDNKVNMSTFDERYQMLEQSLQHALSRLDQYVIDETSLKEALGKLRRDLNSKMDTDAEKKLKKFLDSRLKEIQDSRSQAPIIDNAQNAAGLRKPMSLSYNCLSCDRPINITRRGVMPPMPYSFPPRIPLGKNEKDDTIESRVNNPYNGMSINRQCGGSHTSVNINMLRMVKINPLQNFPEAYDNITHPDKMPVTDCVMGNDGHIYRGRFRLYGSFNDSKHRSDGVKNSRSRSAKSSYKETLKKVKNSEERSHSANCKAEPSSHESLSLPPIKNNSQKISQEG